MHLRTLAVLVGLNAVGSSTARAQEGSRPYAEVTVGAGYLLNNGPLSGKYYNRGAPTALLTLGTQPDSTRSFLAALHVGWLNALGFSHSDVCRLTPLGGCYQQYPLGGIIAIAVGGRPLTRPWTILELTAGPAYIGHHEGRGSFGALVVGRFGHGPGHYLAAGISLLGLVTTVDGHLVFMTGAGLSLRSW